jgi:hypothetical protein
MSGRFHYANRAAHARAPEAAIAVRILREVLLVIALGVVKFRRVEEFGRDVAVAILL